MMQFLTRELFDTIIVVIIIVGVAWAVVRIYGDLTRPMPPDVEDEDTQPNQPIK